MHRYDVRHAVMNDPDYTFLKLLNVTNWPTLIVIGPDGRELMRVKGEHKEERITAFI